MLLTLWEGQDVKVMISNASADVRGVEYCGERLLPAVSPARPDVNPPSSRSPVRIPDTQKEPSS